jgi:ABC-type Na+ efflux pump permease subunit
VRTVSLIAANFLREHRWPVLILFAWIVLTAAATADFGRSRAVPADVDFYVEQQAMYICVFSAFLAADAIHSERKSRRILLLLSKAVSRGQYLLAVILGTWTMAIAYALLFGICGVWLTAQAVLPSAGLWPMVALVIAGSLVAATVAMCFSTFLNPYVATAFTVVLFALPGVMHAQRYAWSAWLPGFPILLEFVRFSFRSGWTVDFRTVVAAVLQSAVFGAAAAAVFNRRDVAIPVE